MTALIILTIWAGADILLAVLERGTGFRTSAQFSPLGTWNLLGWGWQLVRNRRDDPDDKRIWPTVVEDQGFAVSPLCFRLVLNRVRVVEQGHGIEVDNETDRERERERARKRREK